MQRPNGASCRPPLSTTSAVPTVDTSCAPEARSAAVVHSSTSSGSSSESSVLASRDRPPAPESNPSLSVAVRSSSLHLSPVQRQTPVTPPPLRLHPALAQPQSPSDRHGNVTQITDDAKKKQVACSQNFRTLSPASSYADLEELGSGAGFHSLGSISSLGSSPYLLPDSPFSRGPSRSRSNSWASSTALPPIEQNTFVRVPVGDKSPLSHSTSQSTPLAEPHERLRQPRSIPLLSAIARRPLESPYRYLPTNNPSFDLAYFLRNTGPSPTRTREADEKRDKGSMLGKLTALGFLKGGGKKPPPDKLVASEIDDELEALSFSPPNVIEKTSKDGAKYFLISPREDISFGARNEKERVNASEESDGREEVTFCETRQTPGTEALDNWIASLGFQQSTDLDTKTSVSRSNTGSTTKVNSIASSTTNRSTLNSTVITEPSSGSPERRTHVGLRTFGSSSRVFEPHKSLLSEKISFTTKSVKPLLNEGAHATDAREALGSNPPDLDMLFGAERRRYPENKARPRTASVHVMVSPSGDDGGKKLDSLFSGLPSRASLPAPQRRRSSPDATRTAEESEETTRLLAPPKKENTSNEISQASEAALSSTCSGPLRLVGPRKGSLKRTCNFRDAQIHTRKMRDFERRHPMSIDGVVKCSMMNERDAPVECRFKEDHSASRQSISKANKTDSVFGAPNSANGNTVAEDQPKLSPVMVVAESPPATKPKPPRKLPPRLNLRETLASRPAAIAVRHSNSWEEFTRKRPVPIRTRITSADASTSSLSPLAYGSVRTPNGSKCTVTPLSSTFAATSALAELEKNMPHSACTSASGDIPTSSVAIVLSPPVPSVRESQLEERVKALEREKMLLESALMAVLKADRELNKCPCQLSSSESADGLDTSALEAFVKTQPKSGEAIPA